MNPHWGLVIWGLGLAADERVHSDERGETTAVIVPISLWREIEALQERACLLKSGVMKRRLLEAKDHKEGLSIKTVIEKLGI